MVDQLTIWQAASSTESVSIIFAGACVVLPVIVVTGGNQPGDQFTEASASADYVNAALLGDPGSRMIGGVIDAQFFAIVDYPVAAALSFVLMAAIIVLVAAYVRRAGTEELV